MGVSLKPSLNDSVTEHKEKKKDKKKKKRSLEENGEPLKEEEKTPKKSKKAKKRPAEDTEDAVNGEGAKSAKKIKVDSDEGSETEVKTPKKKKKDKKKANESSENGTSVNGADKEKVSEVDNATLTPEEKEGAFSNFNIAETTIEKLKVRGVKYLFPVQSRTFNHVYGGHDVIAQARTGTGKTFSFAIPLIERLQEAGAASRKSGRNPQVLCMAPTRELAKQIADDFKSIAADNMLNILCVYGGTPYAPQENQIRRGLDILVGTPGRLADFLEKGTLKLEGLKHLVLDEVDRMLDMGFAEKVEEILSYAYNKEGHDNPQCMLFSATLPKWVHDTARKYMKDDVHKVDVIGDTTNRTATTVQHLAIKCGYHERAATIGQVLAVYSGNHGRAMVFCQTKRDADELTVSEYIKQETHVLHGDIPQDKREMVLKGFREGRYKCLITTDVAARGLDIPEVDLVIQCSPPKDIDSYIHRSGRTGRAGRTGTCILFYKPAEEQDVGWVERQAGVKFKRVGAPTAEDMISSAAEDATRSLAAVPEATLAHFRQAAQKLLDEKDAVEAVAAALACLSGHTEIKERSLLNSSESATTYVFRTNIEMRTLSYAWNALGNQLGEEKEKVKGMRFCADKMGCVFDIPSDLNEFVMSTWQDGKFDSLTKATELPELLEQTNRGGGGGGGGWGRGGGGGGRSFGGGGRGGGGFRGGRGRGGSGGGFRGRGGGGGRGFQRGGSFNSGSSNSRKTFD